MSKIIELLEENEWSRQSLSIFKFGEPIMTCPICRATQAERTHYPGCWLDQALAELRKQPEPTEKEKWIKRCSYFEHEVVPELQAKLNRQAAENELLKECDDTSTQTISEMDKQIKRLKKFEELHTDQIEAMAVQLGECKTENEELRRADRDHLSAK